MDEHTIRVTFYRPAGELSWYVRMAPLGCLTAEQLDALRDAAGGAKAELRLKRDETELCGYCDQPWTPEHRACEDYAMAHIGRALGWLASDLPEV